MTSTQQDSSRILAPHLDALRSISSSGVLKDSDVEAMYGLAYHRLEQAHFEDARRYFSALAMLRPTDVKCWRGLALTERLLTHYDAAVQLYKYIALLEPDNLQHELDLAECQLLLKDYSGARATFDALIASSGEGSAEQTIVVRAKVLRELTPQ